MPNIRHRMLTHERVETTTKPGTYSDGEGLTLRVSKSGRKHWVLRVTIDGTQRNIGLGPYPAVGLAEARIRAKKNQGAIRQGRDPVKERRAMEQARSQTLVPTFREASETVIEFMAPAWRTTDSAKQWQNSLSNHVFPMLGDKPVNEITSVDVVNVLTPIWLEKEETSRRVLQRMERIFEHSIMQGWREDNPAGRHIKNSLPKQGHHRERHKIPPYEDIPDVFAAVRNSPTDEPTKLALQFMVLCAARSREVCSAEWNEIDLDNQVWDMPAVKTKARRNRRIPLSDQAVEILIEARPITNGEGLVFPSTRSVRQGDPKRLSDPAFNTLWRRMQLPGVPHGLRSSFVNWAMTEQHQPLTITKDLLDHIMGRVTSSVIERSFAFKDAGDIESERRLLQNWGHFVTTGETLPFEQN